MSDPSWPRAPVPAAKRPIILSSHPGPGGRAATVRWGEADPRLRGPVIATPEPSGNRNAIGTHAGAYALYRALAVAAGQLKANHRPDLTNTLPAVPLGPFAQWGDPAKIVSIDPWGHLTAEAFREEIAAGMDIRPSIAVTRAHINMPELVEAMRMGRLSPDGEVLGATGDVRVTKVAIEPVWWLPGIAERFGISETALRRGLFEQTGGMFTDLVTRSDLKVFLPPIGGMTVYLFGDPTKLGRPETRIACRIHDECNGSDVFGSDICTCRPYLVHGIEVCIEEAQRGGVGVIVYNRKEGRALGEVTKFLVYNARKRQEGGDRAESYFTRTECVAGVSDMRFQELMPDVLHWLGIARIDRLVSMSNMKFEPIVASGIAVMERVPIPDELIPADARVEMDAKKAAGYFSMTVPDAAELAVAKGRGLQD
ncbi:GTP cyclohydrolase II [Roseomonas sp. OT10]|uniref:GTP cyclohydrolase II n=1 Tax=Roseomonas cutis TaxID=2897332 RepID=UPI001E4F767A|nr:GTP cyclohydrolase II [Roseomonas sp. OT10]UFN47309.1 GTP cyclohydrolase II [Roseomonas sp. OT10]